MFSPLNKAKTKIKVYCGMKVSETYTTMCMQAHTWTQVSKVYMTMCMQTCTCTFEYRHKHGHKFLKYTRVCVCIHVHVRSNTGTNMNTQVSNVYTSMCMQAQTWAHKFLKYTRVCVCIPVHVHSNIRTHIESCAWTQKNYTRTRGNKHAQTLNHPPTPTHTHK